MISNVDLVNKYNTSLLNILKFELIKLPQMVYDTIPITIVAATLLVMITLIKQNELIAYVSLGGRILHMAIPFLFIGLILSALLFVLSEKVNPKIETYREKFKQEVIKKNKFVQRKKLFDLWIRNKEKVFMNVEIIDPETKTAKGITEYYLDDKYKVSKIREIESGTFKNEKWYFENEKVYTMEPYPKLIDKKSKIISQHETLKSLIKLPADNHKYLNSKDMKKIIKLYKEKGLNADRFLLYFYKIYAHPLSIIVLILAVLPMSITLSRHQSYILIASKSLIAGFTYWILNASLFSISKTGLISPFIANFLPHLLLFIFAIFYIFKREKGE
jgi:lipopolysaccharide export system permease protein